METKPLATILLILTAFLNSCGPSSQSIIGDGGLLTPDIFCGPPCLWNITPGITHESQARNILAAHRVAQACKNEDYTAAAGWRDITCALPGNSAKQPAASLTLFFKKGSDIITELNFEPTSVIELRDILQRHGKPTCVEVFHIAPNFPSTDVSLWYESILTDIYLGHTSASVADLRPDTPIVGVTFQSRQGYRGIVDCITDPQFPQITLEPWMGYGQYR
jgi:hypothetical protein